MNKQTWYVYKKNNGRYGCVPQNSIAGARVKPEVRLHDATLEEAIAECQAKEKAAVGAAI